MLEAFHTGGGAKKEHKMEIGTEGGVSILKELLTVISEGNENTHAMLQRSVTTEERRHQIEVERLQKIVQQSEKA